jgi:hypothetical protein
MISHHRHHRGLFPVEVWPHVGAALIAGCATMTGFLLFVIVETLSGNAILLSRSQIPIAALDKSIFRNLYWETGMMPIWFIAPAVILCAGGLIALGLASMGAW